MSDKSKKISLLCPICGNDLFFIPKIEEGDFLMESDDETKIQCSDCKAIFSKDELIEENREIINGNIEDIVKETLSDLEKKLKRSIK